MRAESLTRAAGRCPAGYLLGVSNSCLAVCPLKKNIIFFLILPTRKCKRKKHPHREAFFSSQELGGKAASARTRLRGAAAPEHLPATCDLRSIRDFFPGHSSVRRPGKLLSALNPAVCLSFTRVSRAGTSCRTLCGRLQRKKNKQKKNTADQKPQIQRSWQFYLSVSNDGGVA